MDKSVKIFLLIFIPQLAVISCENVTNQFKLTKIDSNICEWDLSCSPSCTVDEILNRVNNAVTTNPDCVNVHLAHMTISGDLKPRWFNNTKINVLTMSFSANDIKIPQFAFNNFESLMELNMKLTKCELDKDSFQNLKSLISLSINYASMGFPQTCLNRVALTLERFTLTTENSYSERIYHTAFTAHETLQKLYYVRFSYSILETVTNLTALTSTKELYLNNAKIRNIGNGAFDPVAQTINKIDLQANELITINYLAFLNVLSMKAADRVLEINLNSNPINCTCDVENFHKMLRCYPNIVKNAKCRHPSYHFDKLIENLQLEDCDTAAEFICSPGNTPVNTTPPTTLSTTNTLTTPTTLSTTNTPTTPITTSTTNNPLVDGSTTSCTSNDNSIDSELIIPFRYGSELLRIIDSTIDGDLTIELIQYDDLDNLILFWSRSDISLTETDYNDNQYCIGDLNSSLIHLSNLLKDIPYLFCIMKKMDRTISPYNCLSHTITNDGDIVDIWLDQDSKPLTISLISIAFLISALCGSYGGYYLLQKFPILLKGSKRVVFSQSKDLEQKRLSFSGEKQQNDINNISSSIQRRHSDADSLASGIYADIEDIRQDFISQNQKKVIDDKISLKRISGLSVKRLSKTSLQKENPVVQNDIKFLYATVKKNKNK